MKIFDAFPSKYLKAADLHGNQIKATMEHVMMEEIKDPKDPDDAKVVPILYFRGVPKGLVVNKTIAKVIALGYGQETEEWRDKPIILFTAMVDAFGDTMEAIRVKLLRKQDGGPSRPEGRRAYIETSDDPKATAEQMGEDWAQRTADSMIRAARVEMPTTTPESMEEARLRFQMRRSKPATKPVVWDLENNALRAPGPRRDNEAAPEHDEDGVVWDANGERPLTDEEKVEAFRESLQRANAAMDERIARGPSNIPAKDDGLDIPLALDRRPKREPTIKERLLGEVTHLSTARDCLTWGLEMDRVAAGLAKVDREEISTALLARQTALLDEHVRPAPHQRRLFPIEGGVR